MKISLAKARSIILSAQGLSGKKTYPKGKEGAAQVVESLGYVQIDTISVVERAHHHTIWSRCPDYDPALLNDLLSKDRRVFEYWCPAAAYVPMSDYRFYLNAMRTGATSSWYRAERKVIQHVKYRLRAEGPLGSVDFKAEKKHNRDGWGGYKPQKHALEALFAAGEVMISERRGFQRYYDLTERVLPSNVDTTMPSKEEQRRFKVMRALRNAGICSKDEVRWSAYRKQDLGDVVDSLVEEGTVKEISVPGFEAPLYVLTEILDATPARGPGKTNVRILSPFDNLVIRRDRLARWFDFDYKFEAYVPQAKRKYGYFCLPILWGSSFVGRMDAKADRKQRTLRVRKLLFEPSLKDVGEFLPRLLPYLRAFAAFNGCDNVVVESTSPSKALREVKRQLKLH